jgi:hypothetical protein
MTTHLRPMDGGPMDGARWAVPLPGDDAVAFAGRVPPPPDGIVHLYAYAPTEAAWRYLGEEPWDGHTRVHNLRQCMGTRGVP